MSVLNSVFNLPIERWVPDAEIYFSMVLDGEDYCKSIPAPAKVKILSANLEVIELRIVLEGRDVADKYRMVIRKSENLGTFTALWEMLHSMWNMRSILNADITRRFQARNVEPIERVPEMTALDYELDGAIEAGERP